MNSEIGKKPSQQQYCMKGVMDFVQEQIKNSSNEWTQEKNMLIKKITELEREVKTLKKVNNNISNKVVGGLLTEGNVSQNEKKTILNKNHKRVESDTLKLNEKKLAKIRCHFMKKKLNSDDLQKNKPSINIRGSKRTLSYGGFDKIFENKLYAFNNCSLFDSIHSNINFNSNSLKKDVNLPSFRVTMYNNINLNSNNNNNNYSQSSHSNNNNFSSSNTIIKKKEKDKEKENNLANTNTPSNKTSVSNTFETIIDNTNQNQIKEDDFLITKIEENRGSFIVPSNKEDNGENLRISVIEKVNNSNSLITKKDPSKPSYNPIIVLKSHFDCVRGIYVTSDSKYIVTVGEDMVVNTWDFKKSLYQNKEYFETYCSFRSHRKPILSICGNHQKSFNNGYSFYTAGTDGNIFHWKLSEAMNDKYDCEYDKVLSNSLCLSWKAHTDSIWHLSHHSTEVIFILIKNILSSLSSDGIVKIWKGFSEEFYNKNSFSYDSKFKPLLRQIIFKNINYNITEIPTSSAWSIRNPNSIYVSYVSPFIKTYDIETGKNTQEFTYNVEKIHPFENFQANKICVSSSFGLVISGNEDRQIRFYDKNQNKCIKNMVAHTDSVSSVCLGNEEYQLLSCSHDGSFRCWDIRKYKLLFDVPAHRKKNDEGCLSIIPNSTYQVIITSGADGLVKIFKNS